MPIYEYQCTDCGHQFDALQKMSDKPLKDCPECMEPALTKLVSAPSFRLSGSGWYETDFKSDSDKKKNLAEGNQAADKSDTKSQPPASKKDSSDSSAEKPKKADKTSSSTSTAAA